MPSVVAVDVSDVIVGMALEGLLWIHTQRALLLVDLVELFQMGVGALYAAGMVVLVTDMLLGMPSMGYLKHSIICNQ